MTGLPAWIALAIVLALLAATPFAAHIPIVREWTGAPRLEKDRPADTPGGTLRHALTDCHPEYLDDIPGRTTDR